MTRIDEKLALALGFDADPACSIDTYCADIVTPDGTIEEHHYIVIADGNVAWAADGYDIARWLDAGGSDYQDLCDSVGPLHDVRIALDFFEQTGGILTGDGGGFIASHKDLAALVEIEADANIAELADEAHDNHVLAALVDHVDTGVLSGALNAREQALRWIAAAG